MAPAGRTAVPAFNVTLRASTHTPVATTRWHYVIRVTDLSGRPIRARARFQIVVRTLTPPPPRELGRRTFRGRYEGVYRWPRTLRGVPLLFRAVVTAGGETRRRGYWIRVR